MTARRPPLLVVASLLPLLLAACGGKDGSTLPDAAASAEQRSKAALVEFFSAVKEGSVEKAARHVVYRGDDTARRWKVLADPSDPDEAKGVESVMKHAQRLLDAGEPEFRSFRTKTESEGTWLAWEITFGSGEKTKKALFACLEVKGGIGIGDID